MRIELGVLQLEVTGRPTACARMDLLPILIICAIARPAEGWLPAARLRAGRCRPSSAPSRTGSSSNFTIAASRGEHSGDMIEQSRTPTTRLR